MIYPHLSEITVIGSDHKNHKYLCFNGSWLESEDAYDAHGDVHRELLDRAGWV